MRRLVKPVIAVAVSAAIVVPNLSTITGVGSHLVSNLLASQQETTVSGNNKPTETAHPTLEKKNINMSIMKGIYYCSDRPNCISIRVKLNYKNAMNKFKAAAKEGKEGESLYNNKELFGTGILSINGLDPIETGLVEKVTVEDTVIGEDVDLDGTKDYIQTYRIYFKDSFIKEELQCNITYSDLVTDDGIITGVWTDQCEIKESYNAKKVNKTPMSLNATSSWGGTFDLNGYEVAKDGIHFYGNSPMVMEQDDTGENGDSISHSIVVEGKDNLGNLYILYHCITNGENDYGITGNTYDFVDNKNAVEYDAKATSITVQVMELTETFRGCTYKGSSMKPISDKITIDLKK
ncbi:MAG: hypothetical protein Q4F05_03250 [bacterium]|nr:hypothetical protein [bacterium]